MTRRVGCLCSPQRKQFPRHGQLSRDHQRHFSNSPARCQSPRVLDGPFHVHFRMDYRGSWRAEAIPPPYLERLLGLIALRPFEAGWDTQLFGFAPRSLAEGLAPLRRRTQRRVLLSEANTLLHYLLGESPSPRLIRRYVTAVSRWDGDLPVRLPLLARALPAAMRLFDPVRRRGPLRRRIDIAMALSDASPQGYRKFYADGSGGYWPLIRLFVILALEVALCYCAFCSGDSDCAERRNHHWQ